jgi:chromosome segregation ATPase
MMNMRVMRMADEKPCVEHEAMIQELSRKTSALETRADYKDKRIDDLNDKMDKIEEKLDKLNETVNKVVLNSVQDDNDLKQRVLALETQLNTREDALKQYKEEARKQRDEDRQKANLRLAYLAVGLTILTIILTYVIPHLF